MTLLGGRYELGAPLGSGGFATVYRARDVERGAEVAVKVVPLGFVDEEKALASLAREAAALRQLTSPHVVRLHDVGRDGEGALFLVMDLVEGTPLTPEALGRPLLPHEVLRVARALFDGLSAAHEAGLVHGDVKPENVLVPLGRSGLDTLKLVDFGIARPVLRSELTKELGHEREDEGEVVMGTPRYMAPEVLDGAVADARSDVYSAGLVLFELLGVGPLHPGATLGEVLRARTQSTPRIDGRVPPPLSFVLERLLARDPRARFATAVQALAAVVDLDTAPVDVADAPPLSLAPSSPLRGGSPPSDGPRAAPRASAPPRLTLLAEDPVEAFGETLAYLDVAMLDALARRERGNPMGRIARATALAFRLELDAAALILEPLGADSPLARALGTTLVAPRARRVTRARIDPERSDGWIEGVPVELGARLGALAVALAPREDGERNDERCSMLLARLDREHASPPATTTLRIAHIAARAHVGELDSASALDLVMPLRTPLAQSELLPFDEVVRSLLVGALAFRADQDLARDELEAATRRAVDAGNALLEARATTALGGLLVEHPSRVARGIAVLDRATTLLAHGDAPSLEHVAQHNRGAALLVQGRWNEATPHFESARKAAHGERWVDAEMLSTSSEVLARLCAADLTGARAAAVELSAGRVAASTPRTAAFAHLALALTDLVGGADTVPESVEHARTAAREAGGDGADAFLVSEVVASLAEAAAGLEVDDRDVYAELEVFARERGFVAFYWFDILNAIVLAMPKQAARARMQQALSRLMGLLGAASDLAKERRTSAPPPMDTRD
ncbi:MAG: serine/threonine protein kinase [Myxococcales bacterium]|nr:serine/threonine protein kinase [Myxococcales bacterium]